MNGFRPCATHRYCAAIALLFALAGCGDTAALAEDHAAPNLGSLKAALCANDFVSWDDVYETIERDVLTLPAAVRPFTRYLGLTNRLNAGACSAELTRERAALLKLVNSLSTKTSIARPVEIDHFGRTLGTIYRIDIRLYNWNRTIVVPGLGTFADGWQAIAAANPYAVAFEGDAAENIALHTGTTISFMFADSVVKAASRGSLYYALLGVPSTRSALFSQLGVNRAANLASEVAKRAAIRSLTPPARPLTERMTERHPPAANSRRLWLALDNQFGVSGTKIFDTYFNMPEHETSAVFSLQNGLHGYALFNQSGATTFAANLSGDPVASDGINRPPMSCLRCHASGILPITDQLRDAALNDRIDATAAAAAAGHSFQDILDLYPTFAAHQALVTQDNNAYRSALTAAGAPVTGPEPIAAVFDRFERLVTLDDGAGNLLYPVENLARDLARLNPVVGTMETGQLARSLWSQHYVESLCITAVADEISPRNVRDQPSGNVSGLTA